MTHWGALTVCYNVKGGLEFFARGNFLKLIFYISIILGLGFGLHGTITGELKLQPVMFFFFGIAFLNLAYKFYKKGEKFNSIIFTIPFLFGVTTLIVMFYRMY